MAADPVKLIPKTMPLFQRISKTRILAARGENVTFSQFEARPVSGPCQAIKISFIDKGDGKEYSMTLYGQEVDRLREALTKTSIT